jgi:hypothetical protein
MGIAVWIHLAHNREHWQTVMNAVANIWVPQNGGNS